MLNFSFMVLTPLLPLYLSEEFGANKDQIGMVLSGYALTALLIRPFSGFIVDSFPRKAVLLLCYFIFAMLFGGYLIAGSLAAFFVVRTLHGAPMVADHRSLRLSLVGELQGHFPCSYVYRRAGIPHQQYAEPSSQNAATRPEG